MSLRSYTRFTIYLAALAAPACAPGNNENASAGSGSAVTNPCTPGESQTGPFGMKFATICPGSFKMGDKSAYNDAKQEHVVTFSDAFEMQTTEVTQQQYLEVMGITSPSFISNATYCPGEAKDVVSSDGSIETICPNRPVELITFQRINGFIAKLNEQNDGYVYYLPSEPEWEYAARAGEKAEPTDLDAVAWHNKNSGIISHNVAQKKSNKWGLYDMLGNVSEATSTLYYPSYLETVEGEAHLRLYGPEVKEWWKQVGRDKWEDEIEIPLSKKTVLEVADAIDEALTRFPANRDLAADEAEKILLGSTHSMRTPPFPLGSFRPPMGYLFKSDPWLDWQRRRDSILKGGHVLSTSRNSPLVRHEIYVYRGGDFEFVSPTYSGREPCDVSDNEEMQVQSGFRVARRR